MFLKQLFSSKKKKAKFVSLFDCFFPKFDNKILFVVKNLTCFSGNLRVVLEEINKKDKNFQIYVYKDGKIKPEIKKELQKKNIKVLEGFSFKSLWHIMTSKIVILSHSPRDAHLTKKCRRFIINLWHGVALKKIELLMGDIPKDKLKQLKNNSKLYDLVIANSEVDRYTNAKAFGVDINKVKITGLPRFELMKDNYILSDYLKNEKQKILNIKNKKKMIVFAPTFREKKKSILEEISKKEWFEIENFCKKNGFIFVIRPHPYDKFKLPEYLRKSNYIKLLDFYDVVETNLLLKFTDILVVDYSSIWVDFLLLKRPIIGFSKDYNFYKKIERGFIYDDYLNLIPFKYNNTIKDLLNDIKLKSNNFILDNKYKKAIYFFHKYDLNFDFKEKIYKTIMESYEQKYKKNKK